MTNYLYSYLIGTLVLMTAWVILFLWRKDARKIMLAISFISGIIGLIVDPIYYNDWWFPQTITGTMPGIESFLFGFAVAGIASIIYIELFSKRLKERSKKKKGELEKNIYLSTILIISLALFFGTRFILKWPSFYASFPAILIPVAIIYIRRKDLIKSSLISGFLLVIIAIPAYLIPELIAPGWMASAWNFKVISGIKFLKIPIEDLIWFFMAGLFIGPLYEYWQEKKLVDKK